jgi:hypothetical protein
VKDISVGVSTEEASEDDSASLFGYSNVALASASEVVATQNFDSVSVEDILIESESFI